MSNVEMTRFFENWDRIHLQSIKVIKIAPLDKFDWKPCETAMTLGELVRHFPEAERFLVGVITGKKLSEDDLTNLKTREELLSAINRIHEECKEAIREMPEGETEAMIQFGGNTIPKKVLMQGMCEHEIHHRGQLYTYVRMVGVIPPPLFS